MNRPLWNLSTTRSISSIRHQHQCNINLGYKIKIRLIPPVGFIQRVAVIDKEIEILGIKFKNGFNIDVPYDVLHTNPVRFLMITFVQHRQSRRLWSRILIKPWIPISKLNKDFWGPNANDFYPERWIEQPDLEKSWFYQPFGGGPRNCIGMRLALIEMKIGILKIIEKFDPVIFDSNTKFQRNAFGFIESNPPLKMQFLPTNDFDQILR